MSDWIMVFILTLFIVVEFYYESYIYNYRIYAWIDECNKQLTDNSEQGEK